MFGNVSDYIRSGAPLEYDVSGNPATRELHVAVLVLLTEAAAEDGDFHSMELGSIVSSMARCFEVGETETGELLEIAGFLQRDGAKVHDFVAKVNESYTPLQRQEIMAVVWKVIASDGELTRVEAHLAAKLRSLLNLSLEQAAWAREMSTRPGGLADESNASGSSESE